MRLHQQAMIRVISLGDQICFSAANFVLTILLARRYSEHELAGYGIGLSIALMLQGVLRNCYLVQNALLPAPVFLRRARAVLGQQYLIVLLALTVEAAALAVAHVLFPAETTQAIALSTLVCTLLYIQLDFDRVVNIKYGHYWIPFIASLLFLAINGALFFAIPVFGIGFESTMLALAGYAIGKMGILAFIAGTPRIRLGFALLKRDFRRYFHSAVLGSIGTSGFLYGPVFVLGAAAPAMQTAAFVAMRGLMQPITVLIRTMDLFDKNSFHARATTFKGGERGLMMHQLCLYGGSALLLVSVLAGIGPWLIHFVYGADYTGFYPVFLGWGGIMFLTALSAPLETMIIKLKRLNTYNGLRILAGLSGLCAAVILCGKYGAMGAVAAILVGWTVSNLCAFRLTHPPKDQKEPV